MEYWEKKINELESLRVSLHLNFNSLEKLSGISRSQLKSYFTHKNIPSIKVFFHLETVLKNHIKTIGKEVICNLSNKTIVDNKICDCYIDDKGIFRRGKSKCLKLKKDHFN